jgi:rubrerythrin/predicted transcriptional regulator
MTIKLSSSKISRLLKYYFQGLPQLNIAGKLGINQATVSLYIGEFSAVVDEEGLETAAKEYGIMDVVQELHSLGAELKKSSLTVEEAKRAFKVAVVLEECGIPEEEYKNIITTCTKMNNDGFLESAMELNQIEESSDMSYQAIVEQASACKTQIEKDKKELQSMQEEITQIKQALATWEHQKVDAGKELQKYMDTVKMNFKRLEKVESLTLILNKSNITDKEIDSYIERQNLLNKAGLSINMLNQILNAAKIQIAVDGGKSLVKKLTEFNGLDGAVLNLKQEKQSLLSETKDLKEKAALKGSIQADVTHLETQKKGLYAEVSRLQSIMQTTEFNIQVLKQDENALSSKVSYLKATVSKNELIIKNQNQEIKTKQDKIADLAALESKRNDAADELATLNVKAEAKKKQLMILEAFEGYMQSTDLDKQEKFVAVLPQILEGAKQRKTSPDFLRGYILKELTGGTMEILKCTTCGVRFSTDKPAGFLGYQCPVCGVHECTLDKDEVKILS